MDFCSRFRAGGAATGDLHVTVKDPRGNLVANAVVKVRDAAKGLERSGNGDGQGGYSVRQLPPGTYSVKPMRRASRELKHEGRDHRRQTD